MNDLFALWSWMVLSSHFQHALIYPYWLLKYSKADLENLKQVQATLSRNPSSIQNIYWNANIFPSHLGWMWKHWVTPGTVFKTSSKHLLNLRYSPFPFWLASGDSLFLLQMQEFFSNRNVWTPRSCVTHMLGCVWCHMKYTLKTNCHASITVFFLHSVSFGLRLF